MAICGKAFPNSIMLVAFLAASLLLILCQPGLASDDSSQAIMEKLKELEARLKKLEERIESKPVVAESSRPIEQSKTVEVETLRQQVDVLATEVEKLRSGEQELEITAAKAKSLGLGESAASIYRKRQGVSLAGYGEMIYENFSSRNQRGDRVSRTSQVDFLRAILYAGYRFNDKFVFNSELEFEHASTGKTGEVSLEFAYLDYLASPYLTLRGGLLLVPMGLTNEFHEPTAFLGARRTETESRIIPSTWREAGFGALGTAGKFQYRAYLLNGLDAVGFSSDGLRGGRQQGSRAKATDLAFVGRLDYAPTPGVLFGGSVYTGGAGQGQYLVEGRNLRVRTRIGEAHFQAQVRGFDVRGLFARAVVGNVAALNRARNLTGGNSIGESMIGGYLQLGYNLLARKTDTIRLTPFYRFEKVNTQSDVPEGFSIDPARDRDFHTMGLEFKPLYNVVIKTDYQWLRNGARTGLSQFNIGLGYAF